MCSTDFNLNLKDFPTLSSIVPARNSVSLVNSLLKLLLLVPFVQVNSFVIVIFLKKKLKKKKKKKAVSASFVRASKPISQHVNMLVLVMFVQVNLLVVLMPVPVILLVLATFVQVKLSVLVMFLQVNLFLLIMSIQVDLCVWR